MTTPVAAAASVPFSATLMKALWTTSEMERLRVPSMPEKSATPEMKADVMPRALSRSTKSRPCLDLEAGKAKNNLLAGQPCHQGRQRGRIQRGFDLAELARIGHHHHQR